MRVWIRLALAALLAGCAALPETSGGADAATQRVMSFNIRYGTAPDGENSWSRRAPLVMRVLRDFEPTVLGVQEALRFQLDEIGREFPAYREIGVGRDDGRTAGEYSAILYDQGVLDVLEQGTFWLSDTPETAGSMSWGNRFVRIATWARFRDRRYAATFYVFNTHWDHESQPARERSAELILERIRQRKHARDPVLLVGDFNAGEDNPAFRALLRNELFDTFRTLHPDAHAVGTYHAFRGDRGGDRIDAILASPAWEVLGAGIVHFAEGGRFPSDHFPVTAVLRLPAGH